MDNFNLRYECLDARDDYAAQRKKIMDLPSFINDDDTSPDIMESREHCDYTSDDDDPSPDFHMGDYGPDTLRHLLQMTQMKSTLTSCFWNIPPNTPDVVKTPVCTIDPSIDWKRVLSTKQQDIIRQRQGASSNTRVTNDQYYTTLLPPDTAEVLDTDVIFGSNNPKIKGYPKLKLHLSKTFSLNLEQIRAFTLVTDHVSLPTTDPLLMYLGGMAGTGKSQVIRAITEFFDRTHQRFKLALLTPTGSSASLIGGSTYHSFLNISDYERMSLKRLSALKSKLQDIEYIILDEVSMLGLRDLYKISAHLAKAKGVNNKPFGGVNMIFAGDFAQLPPPMKSTPLYGDVSKRRATSYVDLQTCIGKTLWLQTTTVVILRQNMRQKTQTKSDNKLRTCLENMRYKACTTDDLNYLQTLSVDKRPHLFSDNSFRHVSIITGLNTQRDEINKEGATRFATDAGLSLTHFYSVDKWASSSTSPTSKQPRLITRSKTKIPDDIQTFLWDLPPSATDHLPGILSLCKGMPVLIKHNQATECCVTNGAEATVVDWISITDPAND